MSTRSRKRKSTVRRYAVGGKLVDLGDGTFRDSEGNIVDSVGNLIQRANVGNPSSGLENINSLPAPQIGIGQQDIVQSDIINQPSSTGIGSSNFNVAPIAGAAVAGGDALGGRGGSVLGGVGKGAALGATVGSIVPGVGTVIGGAVGGIIGGVSGALKKTNEEKARDAQNQAKEKQLTTLNRNLQFEGVQRGIALAGQNNGFKGQQGKGFFRNGGTLQGRNGVNLLDGEGQEISDGVFLTQGDSHREGGINLDLNSDSIPDAEIEGQEILDTNNGRVFSKKLKPSKDLTDRLKEVVKKTSLFSFAKTSEDLNKQKAKLQEKEDSGRSGTTKQLMLDRIDKLEEELFNDQQMQNNNNGGSGGVNPPSSRRRHTRMSTIPRRFENGGDLNTDELEARRIAHINNLGLSGKDEDVLSFQRRILIEESKEKDRLGQFSPVSFTSQIQKALPNTQDRMNPELVRKFMTGFNSSKEAIDFTNEGVPTGQNGLNLRNIDPELSSGALSILNFGANRRSINQLETEFNPNLIQAQNFEFNDTSSARERKNAEATRQVLNSIDASSTQTGAASKAALLANRLRADNEVNISEQNRRDSAVQRFRGEESRRNIINANIANQAAAGNLQRRNQLTSLRQGARNTLIGDIQANRQTTILNQNEKDKALLTALQQGDRGTITRMLQQYPELAERFGLTSLIQ